MSLQITIRKFGKSILKELKLLCQWPRKPPSEKQWTDFYSRFTMLLILYEGADDDAGRLARAIGKELESLFPILVDAMDAFSKEQTPDLSWK